MEKKHVAVLDSGTLEPHSTSHLVLVVTTPVNDAVFPGTLVLHRV